MDQSNMNLNDRLKWRIEEARKNPEILTYTLHKMGKNFSYDNVKDFVGNKKRSNELGKAIHEAIGHPDYFQKDLNDINSDQYQKDIKTLKQGNTTISNLKKIIDERNEKMADTDDPKEQKQLARLYAQKMQAQAPDLKDMQRDIKDIAKRYGKKPNGDVINPLLKGQLEGWNDINQALREGDPKSQMESRIATGLKTVIQKMCKLINKMIDKMIAKLTGQPVRQEVREKDNKDLKSTAIAVYNNAAKPFTPLPKQQAKLTM